MMPIILLFLTFMVFGKLMVCAFRSTWSIMKVLAIVGFMLVFIFGVILRGLIVIALPVLLIAGLLFLIEDA